eukprot:9501741-Pyramimonas_sp.AAC.1
MRPKACRTRPVAPRRRWRRRQDAGKGGPGKSSRRRRWNMTTERKLALPHEAPASFSASALAPAGAVL